MNDFGKTLLVGSGGFLGANLRYWLGGFIQARSGAVFPWQTLAINATGSLVMGLFMGLSLSEAWNPNWRLFFAVGVLGGYTTFSTFSYETVALIGSGSYAPAVGYIIGSVLTSVAGAWLGLVLARLLGGGNA